MGKGALGQLAAYWPEDTARYAHVPLKRVTEVTVHAIAAAEEGRVALVTGTGPVTYGTLSATVRSVAAALRAHLPRGARVAVAVSDPGDLAACMLGAFEAEMLAWVTAGEPPPAALAAFAPELVVGSSAPGAPAAVSFTDLVAGEKSEQSLRQDLRTPILAMAKADGSGEVFHNHKTLAATAIAFASFFMIDAATRVVLCEPPTGWLGLATLLGTWQRGGTLFAAWGDQPAALPERVDYVVCGWKDAEARFLAAATAEPRLRIGAGALVGIETPFSVSRRRRLARRLRAPVLTVFGRNDLGPVLGSHPTWFLDDAVGIPLPNVDTRPMNPKDGTPLNIGWDAVEEAEIGVKSALAPAGGVVVDEWLRSGIVGSIDPTGLFFFRGETPLTVVK
jgi:acyl-CoA synthetase (AMP-forming)/AMP-acid ligase II